MSRKTLQNRMGVLKSEWRKDYERYKELDSFARVPPFTGPVPNSYLPACETDKEPITFPTTYPTKCVSTNNVGCHQILECSNPNSNPSPDNIAEVLKTILQRQKNTNNALRNVSNELSSVNSQLTHRITAVQANNIMHRRNFVFTERLFLNFKKEFPGMNDDEFVNFEEIFPITTVFQLSTLESRLQDSKFRALAEAYLRLTKVSASFGRLFRHIATDNVYAEFNLDGRTGKRALNSLLLFKEILFVCCADHLGRPEYQKELRQSISAAHIRFNKNKKNL